MLGASSNAHGSGRVWAGLATLGRAPAPRHSPAKVLYVTSMFSEQLFFPWQPPLHIPFPAPRCEADLPCAPRACPALRIYENKTKAEPGRTGHHETQAGAPHAGLGLSLPRSSPSGCRGSSLHQAQRQGAPGVSLSPGTAGRNTKSPLLPGTPSSLPRCQEGVPDGCPGGARLSWGWQSWEPAQDLGGKTGGSSGVWEHWGA